MRGVPAWKEAIKKAFEKMEKSRKQTQEQIKKVEPFNPNKRKATDQQKPSKDKKPKITFGTPASRFRGSAEEEDEESSTPTPCRQIPWASGTSRCNQCSSSASTDSHILAV